MTGLAEAVQGAVGQPASVRVGLLESIDPPVVTAQGAPFEDVGFLESYEGAVGDVVILLGQSSATGSDPASWLALGAVSSLLRGRPVSMAEDTDIAAFANTAYATGSPICGVSFVAPPSGVVRVDWHARFETNTTATRSLISVEVSEGATLGAGTAVSAASDASALENANDPTGGANTRMQAGMWRLISTLTPGETYNAVVMHKMASAGNGDIFDRSIMVTPY